MQRITVTALALWFSLAAGGCTGWPAGNPTDPETESSSLRKQIRELETLLAAERQRSENLASRVNELVARDRQLTAGINRLKLMNEQQEEQIETLKAAPAERDAYKKRAEMLTLEVRKLSARIAELESRIDELERRGDGAADLSTTKPGGARLP